MSETGTINVMTRIAWAYVINDGSGTPRLARASDSTISIRQEQAGEYVVTFPPAVARLSCVATLNNRVGLITAIPGDNSGLQPNQVRVLTLTLDNKLAGNYDFTLSVFAQGLV